MTKGKKYGRALVRACPDALDGKIITGTVTAANPNFTTNLNGIGSSPTRAPEPFIEGVTIQALPGNVGLVLVVEEGGQWTDGYPLYAGASLDLHIDRLSKVLLFIPNQGDVVAYCAIAAAVD